MLEKLFDRIGQMQGAAATRTVFGEPMEVRGRTIIPVARLRYGFGMGSGRGRGAVQDQSGEGGGGGGGVSIRPLAVVEVTDQATRVTSIVDVTRLALAGIAMVAWSVFWIARAVGDRGRRSHP